MTKRLTNHVEPKKVIQALTDPIWIEAMRDELLQFKLQKVWTLVDLPYDKRAIRTKWVYKNKKDERVIVIRNKARLVVQGYTQEEGIDYDEIDVNSAFLYGKIEEEVYVCQPPGFEDPEFPDKVYKVEKALYGIHQALRGWYETLSTYLMDNGFQRVTQKDDGIFISQDKYVDEILKKFGFSTVKITSTPMETSKPLLKDAEAKDVDVHLYRSMTGSLMYLTASWPNILLYLKGQPKLCLWYPKDSPFNLEAYTDSDYAGASLDRKSTTGGCQFLGSRLISWQCNKKTVVANSTKEAEKAKKATEISQSSGPIYLVLDHTVIKEWEDRMERATTTASSLEAEQDSGSGPRCQDTILGDAEAQIRFEAASKQSNNPPFSRVNTLGSGEDNIKLNELMELCTKLSDWILDLG
ncbi:putative ribonuclease H-like domain-containing protein [Tanacetum coccineum]